MADTGHQINRAKGLPLALLGVLFFTPDAAMHRLTGMDAWTLLMWRDGFTALTLFVWIGATHPWRTLQRFFAFDRLGWLAVATLCASNMGFVHAVLNAPAADALVVLASSPLIAALAGWIGFGERVPLRTWIAIAAVFCGILITLHGTALTGGLFGSLVALIAAVGFAVNLSAQRFSRADPIPVVAMAALLTALISLGILLLTGGLAMPTSGQLTMAGLNGFLLHPASFALIAAATRFLPGAEIALISLIEVLIGPFWVWLVFSETPTVYTLLGGTIVLGTLLIHTLVSLRSR